MAASSPRPPVHASVAALLAVCAFLPRLAAASPLCPPARPPRPGEHVLLDLPTTVRDGPAGRVLWTERRFGSEHPLGWTARTVRVEGDWLLVEAGGPRIPGGPRPARGWIALSAVQPVCVIRSDRDLAALPPDAPRVRRLGEAPGDEAVKMIGLHAFGHATGKLIEVQSPFEHEYLFETGDERRPIAYFVDSEEMTAGGLVALGPEGPAVWKSEGRINLRAVLPTGEIVLGEDFSCMPLERSLAVREGRFVTVATRFSPSEWTVPAPAEGLDPCTMIDGAGRSLPLAPGERLRLDGLDARGRIRVQRRDGGRGAVDPSLAASCFAGRLCAG